MVVIFELCGRILSKIVVDEWSNWFVQIVFHGGIGMCTKVVSEFFWRKGKIVDVLECSL